MWLGSVTGLAHGCKCWEEVPAAAVSHKLPVVMAATADPAVLLLLLKARPGRAAQMFALLFGLLQDPFV